MKVFHVEMYVSNPITINLYILLHIPETEGHRMYIKTFAIKSQTHTVLPGAENNVEWETIFLC